MNTARYILHDAPDNASLIDRLALEELRVVYRRQLVDRRRSARRSPAYRALIQVLETPQGAIFGTAAILLWLSDTHRGLGPKTDDPQRGALLKWPFFLFNTLHPALRVLFYPAADVGQAEDHRAQFTTVTRFNILRHLHIIDQRWGHDRPGVLLDLYLGPMVRWLALSPTDSVRTWFDLSAFAAINETLHRLEQRPAVAAAQLAERLGATPFTSPHHPTPPEGSAT